MVKRNFKNWLSAYAHYTRHSESPDLFHFWTGVWTIAGALRRQVWNDQRIFQWTPNFYIVLVGPPGITAKSTTLRLGERLLAEVDGVHFGPSSMTWQGLTDSLVESNHGVPWKDDLLLPMSCITCSVKELGTFLRTDDKDLISALIDLWDGQLEVWKRKTRYVEGQVEIENPWINLMGCTTPAWLRDNIPEVMIGGGLISRIVFVYGEEKRRLIPYPADLYDKKLFDEEGDKLIEDLRIIAQMVGEYHLTPEAKEWGTHWYTAHWGKRPEHMISDRYGGYLARKQTHIHKLAMVIAASKRSDLYIEKVDLQFADSMVTGLEKSMQQVFESIGVVESSRSMLEMLAYVRAYGEVEKSKLFRHLANIMSWMQFQEAIVAGVNAGYIVEKQHGNEMTVCAIEEHSPQSPPDAAS